MIERKKKRNEVIMNIIQITITIFIILESTNIITMYFYPNSKYANSVGVFKAFEDSKEYPELRLFIEYLVNWVAGTKLIFIALLIVILTTGSDRTQLITAFALIASILSYFWRLSPIVGKLDKDNQMEPKGYSKALNWMIAGMILMFLIAITVTLL